MQPGITENTQAVSSLQGAVTDLKTNNTSLATTIQDNQAKVEKQITNPDVIHFKGVTLSPTGSFLAGETVYRTHATGSDIPTPFSSLPYEHADAYALSEFYGTARQSRVALMAEGHTGSATLRGYYEADWLGTGVSSNNNESNSYVFRQRVLWGQAALNNGWAFTGGQLWSLATEDRKGISNLSGDIMLPLTIDPNYVPGFVWERQYGFRVTKTMDTLSVRHRSRESSAALHRHAGRQHSLRSPRQRRYERWTLQRRHQHLHTLDQHRELHQPSEWRHRQLSTGLQDGQRLRQHRQLLLQHHA